VDRNRTESGQTAGEELANSLSHGLGFVAALVGGPVLLASAARRGGVGPVVGAAVFVGTMLLLYLSSCLYHALPPGRFKGRLLKLDHAAIYLFIAGTYTPFTLGVLRGNGGALVGVLIWSLALAGVALMATGRLQNRIASTGLYLAMGWLVLIGGGPMLERVPASGIAWLLAGGVAYTVGVGFYALTTRVRFSHLAWHVCVLAGSTCHYFAVLWHAS
jgi:hemolysin III